MIKNELDSTDRQIISLLQRDSSVPHKEIGRHVHKSPTAIHTRIKRLLEQGYIKAFAAVVDYTKMGRGLTGFVSVTMEKHTEQILVAFMAEVNKFDEVVECYHITGAYDFLIRVAIRDMNEYNDVLLKKLANLPGIESITSQFVLSSVKN